MPELNDLWPKLAPVLVPLVFVIAWCAVAKVMAASSGWERLATRFELSSEFTGKRYRFQSGVLTGLRFNNALEIGVSPRGLYLSQFILFRIFHKPLLIPWSEIRATAVPRLWMPGYRMTFRSLPGVWLDVSATVFGHLAAYVKVDAAPASPADRAGGGADEEAKGS